MDAGLETPVMLKRRPRMRFLRTMAFAPYRDIPAALRSPGFAVLAPDATAMVVFDGSTMHALNLVAAFVWDLLDGTRSVEAAVQAVRAAFSVDHCTANQDVNQLCSEFLRAGLVEPVADECCLYGSDTGAGAVRAGLLV